AAAHSLRTLRRVAISLLQLGNACAAAFIAWSSSLLVQSGTSAQALPVAGWNTPVVFVPFTAFPSMVIVCCAGISGSLEVVMRNGGRCRSSITRHARRAQLGSHKVEQGDLRGALTRRAGARRPLPGGEAGF